MKKFLISLAEKIFPELKYWEFYNRRRSINWRDIATDPSARACRAVHYPWWRLLLWEIGIEMRLKREDR